MEIREINIDKATFFFAYEKICSSHA
jgi:hypothetical protein